jgi:hypothetical protein
MISSLYFFVTSQCKHILSNGHSSLRAVFCIIAVKNDCGLKNPPSHTDGGSLDNNEIDYFYKNLVSNMI